MHSLRLRFKHRRFKHARFAHRRFKHQKGSSTFDQAPGIPLGMVVGFKGLDFQFHGLRLLGLRSFVIGSLGFFRFTAFRA